MRIDLHTHSSVSDGTDSPAELVTKAAAAGLDVVALTDHDILDGWAEATTAAEQVGIRLVRGVEVSTTNAGQSQHLLGYEPDPGHAGLGAILAKSRASRDARAPQMVDALRNLGYDITVEAVLRHAGDSVPSKNHVANALQEAGVVATRDEAFDTLIGDDGPAYVSRFKPTIEEAITLLVEAGAAPVIAHPWARKSHITEERFADLQALGLVGIEVDHQKHTSQQRADLRAIAANLGLLVTGSSDYHGTNKENHDLGCNTTDPEVFAELMSRTGA